jgi:transcriptional regulator with XRE-family HTH domain
LVALRGTDRDKFYAFVKALRTQNWPLRAIAESLGVSRTAVQVWENKYSPTIPLPTVEKIPTPTPKDRTSGTKRKELTPEAVRSLRELAQEASSVRRYTDMNAESRRAAALLESKLFLFRSEGISLTQLADACGVSRSAIAQRLRKFT